MRTLFITGNHLRHFFLVKSFSMYFRNYKWIIEKRDININHKKFLKKSRIYSDHIKDFHSEESKLFKIARKFPKTITSKITYIHRNKITSKVFNDKILDLVKDFKPKFLFSYGCQKIDVSNFKLMNIKSFNIHGGLLPKYRGVNTNFWPHINFDSNQIGLTLHKLDHKIDSGNIYYQTSVSILDDDTINSLSCRAIFNFCKIVPKKIYKTLTGRKKIVGIKTRSTKKIYMKKDFKISLIPVAVKLFKKFRLSKKNKKTKLLNIN